MMFKKIKSNSFYLFFTFSSLLLVTESALGLDPLLINEKKIQESHEKLMGIQNKLNEVKQLNYKNPASVFQELRFIEKEINLANEKYKTAIDNISKIEQAYYQEVLKDFKKNNPEYIKKIGDNKSEIQNKLKDLDTITSTFGNLQKINTFEILKEVVDLRKKENDYLQNFNKSKAYLKENYRNLPETNKNKKIKLLIEKNVSPVSQKDANFIAIKNSINSFLSYFKDTTVFFDPNAQLEEKKSDEFFQNRIKQLQLPQPPQIQQEQPPIEQPQQPQLQDPEPPQGEGSEKEDNNKNNNQQLHKPQPPKQEVSWYKTKYAQGAGATLVAAAAATGLYLGLRYLQKRRIINILQKHGVSITELNQSQKDLLAAALKARYGITWPLRAILKANGPQSKLFDFPNSDAILGDIYSSRPDGYDKFQAFVQQVRG